MPRRALALAAALAAALLAAPLAPRPCPGGGGAGAARADEPPPTSRPAGDPDERTLLQRTYKGGVMGTSLQIDVLGPDPAVLERAIEAAQKELARVEDAFTDWRPSELTRLNDQAGKGPFKVSRELGALLRRSLDASELTGGAFDVTFASVGKLWDYKRRPPRVPTPEEVKAALVHVGWRKVGLDLERSEVTLPAGTRIGLGGIAKGYGVDRAMDAIMRLGVRHAFLSAGGDLKALGRKHGKPWVIAVKHPRDKERVLAVVPVSNVCISTSGDYERFFLHEGRRYHHILDPRTGYPSTGCISATVIAPESVYADGLATAMCVLGPEQGLAIIEKLRRVEAILVDLEGKVHMSRGLKRHAPPAPGK